MEITTNASRSTKMCWCLLIIVSLLSALRLGIFSLWPLMTVISAQKRKNCKSFQGESGKIVYRKAWKRYKDIYMEIPR